ncbi:MAG: hypothetical protein LBF60_03360 [Treponema sp.]|nr:hypothetical protein [Treponema sp.]
MNLMKKRNRRGDEVLIYKAEMHWRVLARSFLALMASFVWNRVSVRRRRHVAAFQRGENNRRCS